MSSYFEGANLKSGLVYESDPDAPEYEYPGSGSDVDGGSDSDKSGDSGDFDSEIETERDDKEDDDGAAEREFDGANERDDGAGEKEADDRAEDGEADGAQDGEVEADGAEDGEANGAKNGEADGAEDGEQTRREKKKREEDSENDEGNGESQRKRRKKKEDVPEEDIMERFEFEIEEAIANWFDEFRIGRNEIPDSDDEDEDPVITRDRKIRLASDDKLAIGKTFFTGFEFKECVLHYALKHRINARQNRWEKDKISFRCAQRKYCDWYVYASYDSARQLWSVKTKCLDHTCTSNGKCKLLKRRVIGRLFMDKLRLQPNYMPLDIQRHIKEQWKLVSTIGQVQEGRLLALQWLKEEYDKQFSHLRGYVAEIMSSNKGSTAIVDTIRDAKGNDVFSRIYVCLGAMKNAFYFCRPIIGIDGTFLKHTVKGCLFTAITHDSNNQIYPVAWATVQSENADNWLWFLNQLKHDLNLKDGASYVILSDRCKV